MNVYKAANKSLARSPAWGTTDNNPWKQIVVQLLMDLDFRLSPTETEGLHLDAVRRLVGEDHPEAAYEILSGTRPEDLLLPRP